MGGMLSDDSAVRIVRHKQPQKVLARSKNGIRLDFDRCGIFIGRGGSSLGRSRRRCSSLGSSAKRSQRGSDGQNAKRFMRHSNPQDNFTVSNTTYSQVGKKSSP